MAVEDSMADMDMAALVLLGQEASEHFRERRYPQCAEVMRDVHRALPHDGRVAHNLAVAEFHAGGCRDPRALLQSLDAIRTGLTSARPPQPPLATDDDGEHVNPATSLQPSKETGVPVYVLLNMAAVLVAQQHCSAARPLLVPLVSDLMRVVQSDEAAALRLCCLLLDVALDSGRLGDAAAIVTLIEAVFSSSLPSRSASLSAAAAKAGAAGATALSASASAASAAVAVNSSKKANANDGSSESSNSNSTITTIDTNSSTTSTSEPSTPSSSQASSPSSSTSSSTAFPTPISSEVQEAIHLYKAKTAVHLNVDQAAIHELDAACLASPPPHLLFPAVGLRAQVLERAKSPADAASLLCAALCSPSPTLKPHAGMPTWSAITAALGPDLGPLVGSIWGTAAAPSAAASAAGTSTASLKGVVAGGKKGLRQVGKVEKGAKGAVVGGSSGSVGAVVDVSLVPRSDWIDASAESALLSNLACVHERAGKQGVAGMLLLEALRVATGEVASTANLEGSAPGEGGAAGDSEGASGSSRMYPPVDNAYALLPDFTLKIMYNIGLHNLLALRGSSGGGSSSSSSSYCKAQKRGSRRALAAASDCLLSAAPLLSERPLVWLRLAECCCLSYENMRLRLDGGSRRSRSNVSGKGAGSDGARNSASDGNRRRNLKVAAGVGQLGGGAFRTLVLPGGRVVSYPGRSEELLYAESGCGSRSSDGAAERIPSEHAGKREQGQLSLEFARLCLRNALLLMDKEKMPEAFGRGGGLLGRGERRQRSAGAAAAAIPSAEGSAASGGAGPESSHHVSSVGSKSEAMGAGGGSSGSGSGGSSSSGGSPLETALRARDRNIAAQRVVVRHTCLTLLSYVELCLGNHAASAAIGKAALDLSGQSSGSGFAPSIASAAAGTGSRGVLGGWAVQGLGSGSSSSSPTDGETAAAIATALASQIAHRRAACMYAAESLCVLGRFGDALKLMATCMEDFDGRDADGAFESGMGHRSAAVEEGHGCDGLVTRAALFANMAAAHAMAGDDVRAEKCAQRALTVKPGDQGASLTLAYTELRRGNKEAALGVLHAFRATPRAMSASFSVAG